MMSTKKSRKKSHSEKKLGGTVGLLLNASKGALAALLISIILAALLSAVSLNLSDPLFLAFPLSLCSLYISSFSAGVICMKGNKEQPILCGASSGGAFILLYMLVSLFLPNEFSSERSFFTSLLLRLLMILFSVLGAYITKNRLGKKRKRRK